MATDEELNEYNNYGFAGENLNTPSNIAEKIGQAATPYLTSSIRNSDNSIYQVTHEVKKIAAVSSLLVGDYYYTQARQSYQNMNFVGLNDANSEYLNQIGCHMNHSEATFSINSSADGVMPMKKSDFTTEQFTQLQMNGSVEVNGVTFSVRDKDAFLKTIHDEYKTKVSDSFLIGATGQKAQLNAIQTIYNRGLESMKNSDNLVAIYDKKGNADAVRAECRRVDNALSSQANQLSYKTQNDSLKDFINQSQLTQQDLSSANRLINTDKGLSTKEKEDLKKILKDRNELHGFINSGAINGDGIYRGRGQTKYGMRIISSKVLGNDMRLGIDITKAFLKVTQASVRATYALTRNLVYGGMGMGLTASQPAAKLIDTTVSKITHQDISTMSNLRKHAEEKRLQSKKRGDSKNDARRRKKLDEWKAGQKQEIFNRKESRLDKKTIRTDKRLTDARNTKNKALEDRLNRRKGKLNSKKERLLNKRNRTSKFLEFKTKFTNKANTIANHLAKPFRAITKPVRIVSTTINAIKKVILKIVMIIVGIVLVIVIIGSAAGALLCFIGGSGKQKPTSEYGEKTANYMVIDGWTEYYQNSYTTPFCDGGRTIASSGCGLCSTATVLTYYSGGDIDNYNPAKVVEDCNNSSSIWTNRYGTAVPYLINTAYSNLGITCSSQISSNFNLTNLDAVLEAGGCAIAAYAGPASACYTPNTYNGIGIFTNNGHYIVIRGGNQKDGYRVIDSNQGHCDGTMGGINEWKPYCEHVFEAEYIKKCSYYYLITPPKDFVSGGKSFENMDEDDFALLFDMDEDGNIPAPAVSTRPGVPIPGKAGKSLGTFDITAYCSCPICCGIYAYNRPKDANGKDIVYGATGKRLSSNYSIAVDPSVIPYGTKVIIEGNVYEAQDCGGAIKGNRIDVYFDNHQAALSSGFGHKLVEIFLAEDVEIEGEKDNKKK